MKFPIQWMSDRRSTFWHSEGAQRMLISALEEEIEEFFAETPPAAAAIGINSAALCFFGPELPVKT
jgi:hypothetical protein